MSSRTKISLFLASLAIHFFIFTPGAWAEHEGCDAREHSNGDIIVTSGAWCSGLHRSGLDWGDKVNSHGHKDKTITIQPGRHIRFWTARNGAVVAKIAVFDADGHGNETNLQEAEGTEPLDGNAPREVVVPASGKVTFWTKEKAAGGGNPGIVDITFAQ